MPQEATWRTYPLDRFGEWQAFLSSGLPDEEAEEHEMRDKVLKAIQALPENERVVTTLFYINGYSQHEIAGFLDVAVTTVKNRLHTSRRRLKERMIGMVDETLKSFPLPEDFTDMVIRKAASQDDLERAAELLSVRGPLKSVEAAERAGLYVVGEEGAVDGAGYFNEIEWTIGSTILKAVRPGEMGGEAEPAHPIIRRSTDRVEAASYLDRKGGSHGQEDSGNRR